MLLAIETACACAGVALWERDALVAERVFPEGEPSGGALVPAVAELLETHGAELGSLQAIALSIGPGSFTGLRVGLSTVLGLTFEREIPVVPVPTLAALALGASGPRVVPLLDARKGLVYGGLYGPGGQARIPDRVSEPEPFFDVLCERAEAGGYALLGGGLARYGALARQRLGDRVTSLDEKIGGPRPAWVARIGAQLWAEGVREPARDVRLRYLRRSEAEEGLERRRGAATGR